MGSRPVIVITGKSRPHELFLLGYSVMFGLMAVLGAAKSNPVLAAADPTMVTLWGLELAGSGALALLGCYWQGSVRTGLALERTGLWFNAAALFALAGAIAEAGGGRVLFSLGIVLAWVIAHVVRALQIRKDLRDLRGAEHGAAT